MTTPSTQTSTSDELAPNYFLHTFSNGLQMVGQRMPSLASVTFGVQFPAGSLEEPDEKIGLAHLLVEMAFQGTQHRDVRQLTEDFEAIGARHGGEPASEYGRFWARVVNNRVDRALELMADVVRYPAFPPDEFNQMKSIQLQEIRRRDDEPMRRLPDMMRERFYAGTRLSRRPLGLIETVEGLTPNDLRQFWQAHFHPNGALIAVAGNFEWEAVVARVGELFGDWEGTPEITPIEQPDPHKGASVEIDQQNQEHIGMMFPFPKYGDPDYYAAMVLSEIFGGGMNSRLFREVREKRGLVYSVQSAFSPNGIFGAESIYAGTNPDKAHETVQVIVDELRKLPTGGVTDDELARAKVQLKSEIVMRGESSSSRMLSLARAWWFERRLLSIQDVKDAVDNVSQEQILHLFERFSPMDRLVITAIGPRPERELIGEVLG